MNYTKLTQAGMNVDEFLKRLMGNERLVTLLIKKFIVDENFKNLKAAFAAGEEKGAEMASHTLKGMCGNLSLTELYELFSEQVKAIRGGEFERAGEMMEAIAPKYETAIALMGEWLAETE